MARHWSAFMSGITAKQAAALDKMAAASGEYYSGESLLLDISGCRSISAMKRADRLTAQRWVDEAFEKYGKK
jgi:hypothetical protein